MTTNFTYAVIGAGIEGSATAHYLAKHGFKTVLLEQFRLGHSRGSSHGCSRITRKSYDNPIYVKMMKRAYELWEELEKESGQQLFKRTGVLYVGTGGGRAVDHYTKVMLDEGLPCTPLDHKEITEKFPCLKYDSGWKGLFDPEGGLLQADKCLKTFQNEFVKYGGVIRDGEAVTSVKMVEDGVAVKTASSAQYNCNGLVICTGTWAKSFLEEKVGLQLPLQPLLVKACYWKVEKEGLFSAGHFPCILTHMDNDTNEVLYGLPSDEYPDLVKFCSHRGVPVSHPDQRDSVDASAYIEKPRLYISRHFNFVQAKPAVVETCMYMMTPDEHFILDIHPKYKNIAIGAGFSGHGFKFAPIVGEILGGLLTGNPSAIDLSMFNVNRFE